MIKHILFDNDGTLMDSETIAVDVMLEMLAPLGFQMDKRTFCGRFPGLLDYQILEIISAEYNLRFPEDLVPRLHERQRVAFAESLMPVPGMDTLFHQLKTPKSMVSNASVDHVERCLRQTGMYPSLDGRIFSAYLVERPKPYPDVYLEAMFSLGLEHQDTIAVEDSATGVLAAKAAGLQVVGFLGASHLDEVHGDRLKQAGADFIADNASHLQQLFGTLGVF